MLRRRLLRRGRGGGSGQLTVISNQFVYAAIFVLLSVQRGGVR